MGGKHMYYSQTGNYSSARRIWRIIYPPLLFIAISIFVIVIAVLAIFVSTSLIGAAGSPAEFDWDTITTEVFQILGEYALHIQVITNLIGLAVFLPMWLRTRKSNEPFKNNDPAIIGLLTVGLFAAFNIAQMVLFTVTDIVKYFPSYEGVTDLIVSDSVALMILAVGIIAPITEELVFRGILISRMKWLPVWATVLIQGVLFGAVHLNLFQGMYAFVAGILLGLVYVKFRSIIIVIFGHMA